MMQEIKWLTGEEVSQWHIIDSKTTPKINNWPDECMVCNIAAETENSHVENQ